MYKCRDKHFVSNYLFLFSQLHRNFKEITIIFYFVLKIVLCFFTQSLPKDAWFYSECKFIIIYYNSMRIRELSLSLLFLPFSYESSHTCILFPTKYSQSHCFLSLLDLICIVAKWWTNRQVQEIKIQEIKLSDWNYRFTNKFDDRKLLLS